MPLHRTNPEFILDPSRLTDERLTEMLLEAEESRTCAIERRDMLRAEQERREHEAARAEKDTKKVLAPPAFANLLAAILLNKVDFHIDPGAPSHQKLMDAWAAAIRTRDAARDQFRAKGRRWAAMIGRKR